MIFLKSEYRDTKANIKRVENQLKERFALLKQNRSSLFKGEVSQKDADGNVFLDNLEKWATEVLENGLKNKTNKTVPPDL